jgi:hypothetical protein
MAAALARPQGPALLLPQVGASVDRAGEDDRRDTARMNFLLTIVVGVVGFVLSYAFFIPPELSMLRLIAAIGVMVGYQVGQLLDRLVRPHPKRFLILLVGAVLCFYLAFGYASMIHMGPANKSDIGAVLGLFFLSLGLLLPFTRILVPNDRVWTRRCFVPLV